MWNQGLLFIEISTIIKQRVWLIRVMCNHCLSLLSLNFYHPLHIHMVKKILSKAWDKFRISSNTGYKKKCFIMNSSFTHLISRGESRNNCNLSTTLSIPNEKENLKAINSRRLIVLGPALLRNWRKNHLPGVTTHQLHSVQGPFVHQNRPSTWVVNPLPDNLFSNFILLSSAGLNEKSSSSPKCKAVLFKFVCH